MIKNLLERLRASKTNSIDFWLEEDYVLDSWKDAPSKSIITLYGLREPLRDEGYVAVTQPLNGLPERTVVFLRDGNDFKSVESGTEVRELRRRERSLSAKGPDHA